MSIVYTYICSRLPLEISISRSRPLGRISLIRRSSIKTPRFSAPLVSFRISSRYPLGHFFRSSIVKYHALALLAVGDSLEVTIPGHLIKGLELAAGGSYSHPDMVSLRRLQNSTEQSYEAVFEGSWCLHGIYPRNGDTLSFGRNKPIMPGEFRASTENPGELRSHTNKIHHPVGRARCIIR